MILFLKILLAHFLGDFTFQPHKWVKEKEKKKIKSLQLYLHIGVHLLLLFVILGFDIQKYAFGLFIIITTHYIFDALKLHFQKKKTKRILFFVDQVLHILILAVVANYYHPFTTSLKTLFNEKILLLLIAAVLLINVSSIIIKIIITQWNPENKKEHDDSLAKAGRYIGVLERLFVFTFVITNHWEGVGFLLAAKSVFRFGDLTSSKDRKLTEYILIGTLLSFGIAIFIGALYLYILNEL
jgi:protein-S-isoprenylcysteine O-methyltransferase Ste14